MVDRTDTKRGLDLQLTCAEFVPDDHEWSIGERPLLSMPYRLRAVWFDARAWPRTQIGWPRVYLVGRSVVAPERWYRLASFLVGGGAVGDGVPRMEDFRVADVDDDGAMSRSLKVVFAVVSGVVALVSVGVVLVVLRQGDLAVAGVCAAVAGVVATLVTGSASAVLAWAAWRHPHGVSVPGQGPVLHTGSIVQKKTSGTTIANSGYMGSVRLPDERR